MGWKWDSSVSLHLKNISRLRVIACPSVEQGGHRGSVSEGRGLQGSSFLPPLQKERIGRIFDLFYLDLLVVNTHCGQGTGHLLLGRGVGFTEGKTWDTRDTGQGEGDRGWEQREDGLLS